LAPQRKPGAHNSQSIQETTNETATRSDEAGRRCAAGREEIVRGWNNRRVGKQRDTRKKRGWRDSGLPNRSRIKLLSRKQADGAMMTGRAGVRVKPFVQRWARSNRRKKQEYCDQQESRNRSGGPVSFQDPAHKRKPPGLKHAFRFQASAFSCQAVAA